VLYSKWGKKKKKKKKKPFAGYELRGLVMVYLTDEQMKTHGRMWICPECNKTVFWSYANMLDGTPICDDEDGHCGCDMVLCEEEKEDDIVLTEQQEKDLNDLLKEDILDRYNCPEYHDPGIIEEFYDEIRSKNRGTKTSFRIKWVESHCLDIEAKNRADAEGMLTCGDYDSWQDVVDVDCVEITKLD